MSADAVVRGQMSRALLSMDARWARQVITGARSSGGALSGTLPLLFGHHLVRIIHEGERLLRAGDPNFGIPEIAALLDVEFSDDTATIRHRSKLLDDGKKSADEVLAIMDAARQEAHETFFGPHSPLIHLLCSDLGLYMVDGAVVGATVPMTFRLGFRPTEEEGPRVFRLSQEWGSNVHVMTLDFDEAPPAVPGFTELNIRNVDRTTSRYLAKRFGRWLTLSEKLLLLLVEGDLNTNLHVLPKVSQGFDVPVFRMSTVALYHSLSTVAMLLQRMKERDGDRANPLDGVMSSPAAHLVLNDGGRQVRNRCVHYAATDSRIAPDPALPMFGLVEAVYPGMTYREFQEVVGSATEDFRDALRDWQ